MCGWLLHRRLPNLVVAHDLAELLKLGDVDEAHAPGDFFGGGDEHALAVLQRLDIVDDLEKGFVGAGVEPGVNFMKPKGLVAAASMISQASRPNLSHMSSNSLARPMLTERKVFSKSLTIGREGQE